MSVAEKNELLFQGGINFNDLPAWQKRGTGLYWEEYVKEGINPQTGQSVAAKEADSTGYGVANREKYGQLILGLLQTSETSQ